MKRNTTVGPFDRDKNWLYIDYDENGVRSTRYIPKEGPTPPTKSPAPPKKSTKEKRERATIERPEPRWDCIHCEGSTGETTKHLCGGCPGGQVTTIFNCGKFDLCLPNAWAPTPDSNVRNCQQCSFYVPDPDFGKN